MMKDVLKARGKEPAELRDRCELPRTQLIGDDWLVVFMEDDWLIFPEILGMSSSQLTNSYFSEGWLNHKPVMIGVFFLSVFQVSY